MMRAVSRILVVSAALVLAPAAALAQQASGPAAPSAVTPAPPASGDLVGPAQLQGFSLKGKVTHVSDEPVAVKPRPRQPAAAAPSPRQTAATNSPAPQPSERVAAERAAPTPKPAQVAAAEPVSSAARQTQPAAPAPKQAAASLPTFPNIAATPAADPAPASLDTRHGGPSPLLWILAAIVLGGAIAFYFFRQRPHYGYAGAGLLSRFAGHGPADVAPTPAPPQPQPQPHAQPAPAPAPAPEPPVSKPTGVVSTRLRPWIELEFVPQRAGVDDRQAAVEFAVTIFNSGSIAALDVLVEGAMFNAGPMQDQQLQNFFANPVGQGERVQIIAPMQRLELKSAVFLPREQLQPIEVEGRPLLVPLVAFNALYRWGSRSEGQSSVSYLVGKTTGSDKLAPFRLDLGPRIFRNLAAREHELRVRK